MSRFNTISKPEHIDEFAVFFDYFKSIKYGDLNFDALWKWSGILDTIFRLYGPNPQFDLCIDIGGGHSPIHRILSNFGRVMNVDQYLFDKDGRPATWFPLNEQGFFEESPGFGYNPDNIEYVTADFLDHLRTLPDNSVSLFVDGCSLIHVNPKAINGKHDGVEDAARQIHRTLKPGGHFVSCCDIYNPEMRQHYPSMLRHDGVTYPDLLFGIYKAAGLQPLDEGDYASPEFYRDFRHTVKLSGTAPYHKRLNPCFACNTGLPNFHAFAQTQDHPMLMARFVFSKEITN